MLSTGKADATNVEYLLKELNSFVNAVNANKVILVGHSLGAFISTAYTLDHPEKVESLILLDPPPTCLSEFPQLMDTIVGRINALFAACKVCLFIAFC
jgi:pimeloyl-ACP methyl ester carboxylesterase